MQIDFACIENDALTTGLNQDAIVPWWSFGKTVIATAALALVRDGKLSLDQTLQDRPFTLRQLLQHCAGLAEYGALAAYHEAVARGEEPWPVPLLLERTEADRLRYEPGQGWGYSNIGYLFVRELIERATDLELGETLNSLVFGPMGLKGVRLAQVPADLEEVALGEVSSYNPGWVYHGLLVGRLDEAAFFLHRLMTGALLPPELLAQMQNSYSLNMVIPDRPWARPGYALGLMSGETTYGTRVVGHTGGGPGSVVAVYHCLGTQRTIATWAPSADAGAVENFAFSPDLCGENPSTKGRVC